MRDPQRGQRRAADVVVRVPRRPCARPPPPHCARNFLFRRRPPRAFNRGLLLVARGAPVTVGGPSLAHTPRHHRALRMPVRVCACVCVLVLRSTVCSGVGPCSSDSTNEERRWRIGDTRRLHVSPPPYQHANKPIVTCDTHWRVIPFISQDDTPIPMIPAKKEKERSRGSQTSAPHRLTRTNRQGGR